MHKVPGQRASSRGSIITYWVTTLILATECLGGGVMGALQMSPFIEVMRHLGYPIYLMTIHGVWYMLAGVALLVPRFPRLKEWAYAGFFFIMSGAIFSHVAMHDPFNEIFPSVILLILTVVSWYFRPVGRKLILVNQ